MEQVSADVYFAIIPEWVLDAEISSNAVRAYAVLRRYADSNGECFPSRGTLAARMRVSVDTLDRVLKELVGIGALVVERRTTAGGDNDTNVYRLMSLTPGGRKSAATGGRKDAARGAAPVRHKPEPINQSQRNQSSAPEGANAGTIIGDWIDTLNHRPPERVIGQMAREVRKLLEEGFDPAVVSAAVGAVSVKGLHPSTVSSEVNTILNSSNGGKVSGARMYYEAAQSLMQDPWEEPAMIEAGP